MIGYLVDCLADSILLVMCRGGHNPTQPKTTPMIYITAIRSCGYAIKTAILNGLLTSVGFEKYNSV